MTTSRSYGAGSRFVVAAFALGAGALAGCGAGEQAPSPPSSAAPPAPAVDLVGRWQSECLAGKGNFTRLTFDITAAEWKLDYDVFGDAGCKTGLGTVHIEGPYRLEGASSAVAGATEGTFSFATRTVTPHAQGFADFLKSANGCGGGDFAVGAAADILDKGCAGLGAYPRATCAGDNDIVRRQGDELHFGERPANNDMCTKEKRPRAISATALRTAPR